MPMDQLTRQIQKNNMWVRRRNTTAERSLHSRLRAMETGYYRTYKQYLRDKMKTESELRDLKEIPAVSGNTEVEESPKSASACTIIGFCNDGGNSSSVSGIPSESLTKKGGEAKESRIHSTRRRKTDIPAQRISNQKIPFSLTDGLSNVEDSKIPHSLVTEPSPMNDHGPEGGGYSPGNGESRQGQDSNCRYNVAFSPRHRCSHFPCTTPTTYHTIALRRNDLIPWTSSVCNAMGQQVSYYQNNGIPLSQQESKGRILPVDQDHCTDHSNHVESAAVKGHQHNVGEEIDQETFVSISAKATGTDEFQRRFHGPAFAPMPRDPILEHIREGSNKPMEMTGRIATRVGVKGKLRGLRCLVNEMRVRNEKSKPREWAVNYGERVPMRILLNPVVPVHIP